MALGAGHRILVAAGVLAASGLVPAAAQAVVHVPAGTRIGELTVFADDVRVDGAVTGSVTIIDGSLVVGPQGRLDDRAVVLGGHATILPGGQIRGDVFQVGGRWPLPEGPAAVAVIAALAVVRVLVAWLLVATAALLRPRRFTVDAGDELAVYPLRTLLVGGLATVGAAASAVVLAITVVGLVLTAALAAVLLSAAALGIAIALGVLEEERRAGRIVLVALLVPGIGELVAALATVTGLGAAIRVASRLPAAAAHRA
jgi:hypothetical protein